MSESPEHLDDMKKFIGAVYGSLPLEEESQIDLPAVLEQARQVAANLEGIGTERLSVLFSDRSHAELILENCVTLKNKIYNGDYNTAMKIAEAFSSIFSKIDTDRFEFAGLNEDDIKIIQTNSAVLYESFNPAVEEPKENETQKLIEGVQNLIEKWEMHKEETNEEDDKILAEGIELGYARAASELVSFLENLNIKETESKPEPLQEDAKTGETGENLCET